ncbi:radical SAM family heme chaperone HemW [Geitlerinema sp. PCC 7407]|uniref:radical SAM family heme chaperone HemW n=1 Tax=Geitlerinema sp. PCC 7407 TaxID=1173025 RepID=UPI00029FF402|nr:radical SAM family heme chaperone HemW [Geitlerinema sp. PCC 7407]AFY64866.1 coproporphyrinogen III oxidase, anaerobic [Geitlerinema sp. PCC 7407]
MAETALPAAAYVHIPFCRRRCYYCDFPVSVVGDRRRGETSRAIAAYVEQLQREIRATPASGRSLQTVFFGGGTPSLLSVEQLSQILATLDQHFGLAAAAEISIEMDPGTFEAHHVAGYCRAGVSRISLGVQAFQPTLLQAAGRTHTVEDIYRAVDLVRGAEVRNLSLDLISGLPHQQLSDWQASLEKAIALGPEHLSCYDLIVEPMTPFGKRYEPGDRPLPSDEMTAQMYRLADQVLKAAGYEHYEVSNYARPGYQCRHNRVYWENQPFYGFGMGAASCLDGQRFTRPRTRSEYFAWIDRYEADPQGAIADPENPAPSETDRLLDTLMLGLRLAEGVDAGAIAQRFGPAVLTSIHQTLAPYEQEGWVAWDSAPSPTSGDRLRLTQPDGFLFSNTVLAALFRDLG